MQRSRVKLDFLYDSNVYCKLYYIGTHLELTLLPSPMKLPIP